MSSILLKYTEDFKVSRPIFPLRINEAGTSIGASRVAPQFMYRPQPIEGDVLSALICKSYEEHFSHVTGVFKVDRDTVVNKVMSIIRNEICTFLDKNLPMRSPKQSKLYRWAYRNMPKHKDFNDGLIHLYTYIRKYTGSNGLRILPEYKDHQDNAIALLDAMRKKYE
jgi:hypothetical protein